MGETNIPPSCETHIWYDRNRECPTCASLRKKEIISTGVETTMTNTIVETVEHALRVERDTLGKLGNTAAANAIAIYLAQADNDSKVRFHAIVMGKVAPDAGLHEAESPTGIINISATVAVPASRMADCVVGWFENGYSEQLISFAVAKVVSKPGVEFDRPVYSDIRFWAAGGTYLIKSENPNSGGPETLEKEIGLPELQAALRIMAQSYPRHFKDLVDENDDAITHDVFGQLVIYGEVIYG